MPASDLPVFDFLTRQAASGKPKLVGSRGSMVAKPCHFEAAPAPAPAPELPTFFTAPEPAPTYLLYALVSWGRI